MSASAPAAASASASNIPICIREAATIFPAPIPEQYAFLIAPFPQRKYRINFRHPAYAPDANLLFTLYAWDHAEGGIHHGLAHSACAIFADNRMDGYLSRTCDGEHGERILDNWDHVLPAADADYYFYVPYASDAPLPPDGEIRPPYRWPLVTNFQDWRFPASLPDIWTRCAQIHGLQTSIAPQSSLTAAVHQRDVSCRITAFQSSTEVAHLIPEHERQWFLFNSMARWNTDLTLDPDNLLRDLSNAVLLRSDMHRSFDQRKFVFFPKSPDGLVLHMLEPTADVGPLYHNTRVSVPQCSLEFLFARFAWSIFPSLSAFLSTPSQSRRVVRVNADTGERVVEEVTNAILLGRQGTASRSNSPTKRSRKAANLGDQEAEYTAKRQRVSDSTSLQASFDSTLPTLEDDSDGDDISQSSVLDRVRTRPSRDEGIAVIQQANLDMDMAKLRQQALARQRPPDYNPHRPPYKKHRPAREELEIMGVEVIDSLEDEDFEETERGTVLPPGDDVL